jgi:hypothetical protein
MVDLTDGRVPGEQLAFAPAELADVTQEQDRADALARLGQRDRAQRHTRAVRLHLGAPRRPPGHHQREPLVHGFFIVEDLGGDPDQ